MSLHEIAQGLQSKGRNNDTMLIHMTPNEIGGLQTLAEKHGGSLTINPETGLPEAGFLDSILPAIAGVGLSFIPGVGPLMAAGLVGGVTGLIEGDLGKGLMAGLGAYGGHSLGTGLGAGNVFGAEAAGGAGTKIAEETAKASSLATNPATAGTGPIQIGQGSQTMMNGITNSTANMGNTNKFIPNAMQSGGVQPTAGINPNMYNAPIGPQQPFMDKVLGYAKENPWKVGAGVLGLGGLMSQQEPWQPPVATGGSNYAGPYLPQERDVDFNNDPLASSKEYQYYKTPQGTNPVPGYRTAAAGGQMNALSKIDTGAPIDIQKDDNIDAEAVQGTQPMQGMAQEQMQPQGMNPMAMSPAQMRNKMRGFAEGGEAEGGDMASTIESLQALIGPAGNNSEAATMESLQALMSNQGQGQAPVNNYPAYVPQSSVEQSYGMPTTSPPPPAPVAAPAPAPAPVQTGGANPYEPWSVQGQQWSQQNANPYEPWSVQGQQWTQQRQQQGFGGKGFAMGGQANAGGQGMVQMEDGSFVVDARTVSELGNGSSEAGQEMLSGLGGIPIKGEGDGVSDSIPATIDGQEPAMVARDEVIFSPEAVARIGGGDPEKGANKLYALMDRAQQARQEADRGEDSGLQAAMGGMMNAG